MFTKKFDKYVCTGESISCEKDGFTVTATVEDDGDSGPPWENSDGHGPVSEWLPKDSKRPGERILCQDRHACRFYDWQEAMKIAKEDGWGYMPHKLVFDQDTPGNYPCGGKVTAGPFTAYDPDDFNKAVADVYQQYRNTMTPGQYTEQAVQHDFDVLKAWCEDEWCWCSVCLDVYRNGVEVLKYAACLGGIEMNYPGSDNDYLTEVANELLDEAIEAAEKEVEQMIEALSEPDE